MSLKHPTIHQAVEDCGALLLARCVDWDGNLLTKAAVTAITYKVYDLSTTPPSLVGSDSLDKTTVIFDSEQTGGNWPYDDGYNFKWMMPATLLPNGGRYYQVEIYVDPASGEDFLLPAEGWKIRVKERLGG